MNPSVVSAWGTSKPILTEVIKAAQRLSEQGVGVDVLSITSWSELARDGMAQAQAYIGQLLAQTQGPVIAASDYVRAVPESIRAFVPNGRSYSTLGTDGFGRSDTRAALRAFFRVDAASIEAAALQRLSFLARPTCDGALGLCRSIRG